MAFSGSVVEELWTQFGVIYSSYIKIRFTCKTCTNVTHRAVTLN